MEHFGDLLTFSLALAGNPDLAGPVPEPSRGYVKVLNDRK